MTDRRGGPPHRRWWVAIAVATVVLSVDLSPVRFPEAAAGRWIVLLSLGATALLVGRRIDLGRLTTSERLLVATFVWVLLVAPMSPMPLRSTVLAAALVGTSLLGVTTGRHVGWRIIEAATTAGLTMVLALAVLIGDRGSGDGRWLGLSEEANALGVLAALAVVFGTSMLTHQRWMGAPALALGMLVLFETAAAVPAVAAALGAMAASTHLLDRIRPGLGRVAATAIGATGAVAAAAILVLGGGALGTGDPDLGHLNRRTGIWSFLAGHVAERPFTGYGPWGGRDLLAAGAFDGRVDWGPTHGHNAFVELATMGGLPAAGLFMAAVAVTGWSLARAGHPSGAVAIALLTMSMTEHLVATPSITVFLIAVVISASSRHRSGRDRTAARSPDQEDHRRSGSPTVGAGH